MSSRDSGLSQRAPDSLARSAFTSRGNRRRRISILATSSFVATSLLSGAGVIAITLTPSIALASTAVSADGPAQ